MARYICTPRTPTNAGAGFPCDMRWFTRSDVCDTLWGDVYFPQVFAVTGGFLSGRIAASINALCQNVNSCGSLDPDVHWGYGVSADGGLNYSIGLHLSIWDALNSGRWSSSTTLTMYCSHGFSVFPMVVSPQYQRPCKQTTSGAGCYVFPPINFTYTVPSATLSNVCTDTYGAFSVTFYDDGTFA